MEQARVRHHLPILIKGKNAQARAYAERTTAENMTRRGVFIRTDQPLDIGQVLRIYPADDGSRAIAKAEVVWLRPAEADEPAGVGAKLLGGNRQWVSFLVHNSMPLEDGIDDDDDFIDDDEEAGIPTLS